MGSRAEPNTDMRLTPKRAPRSGTKGALAGLSEAIRQLRTQGRGNPWGWLFIMPAVILFLVFNAWPILRGLSMAFQDYYFLNPGKRAFNGLDNFTELIADKTYYDSFGRSLYYAILYFIPRVTVSLLIAILISRLSSPFASKVCRIIVYLPVVLPVSVAIMIWTSLLLNPSLGYVNHFLSNVLHTGLSPGWTTDPKLVMPSMSMTMLWKDLGTPILLYLIGLYNIPTEIYEAARIDGAGEGRLIWHVTLPLMKPFITLVTVLSADVIGVAQVPMIFFGVPNTGPQGSGLTVGYYSYQIAFLIGQMRWGYAAAISLTVGLAAMVISFVIFRLFRSERMF